MREKCIVCGMVANLDPSLHAQRYAHDPIVRRHGERHTFDWYRFVFTCPSRACDSPETDDDVVPHTAEERSEES